MTPTPELIKYQPASDIQLVPCAYVLAEPTNSGKTFKVSNVDGFANGQLVSMIFPNGGSLTPAALAASGAVDTVAKTITYLAAPVLPTSPSSAVFAGATLLGPSLLALGGTNGGVRFMAKPDMVNVEYDQVEGDVDSIAVHWSVSAAFTMMEYGLDQWGMLSQQGYSTRAASVTAAGSAIVNSANIIDQSSGRVQKFGALFIFDKQDPSVTALKDKLLLYKVAAIDGIESSFTKRDPTNLPVTFHALADPQRPRGKRFYQLLQEIAAGT